MVHFNDAATYQRVPMIDSGAICAALDRIVVLCRCISEGVRPMQSDWRETYALFANFITHYSDCAKVPAAKFLAKIHKPSGDPLHPFSCRLLVCSVQWHTTAIAQIVHYLLFPLVIKQPSFCASSLSLIRMLATRKFPPDCLLFTLDVNALYPSIDLSLAFRLIRE